MGRGCEKMGLQSCRAELYLLFGEYRQFGGGEVWRGGTTESPVSIPKNRQTAPL